MKRLNWLRNFGLIATAATAAAPAILSTTSCAVTSCYIDMFDFKTTYTDSTAKNVKHYSTSFNNLLYGSMSNHDGNYILFVGSNTNETVDNFFGKNGFTQRDRADWYNDDNFYDSAFYKGIVKAYNSDWGEDGPQDCGFYLAIDFFDGKFYDKKKHEIFISKEDGLETRIIKPFDKWDQKIITQTKIYNKNKPGWNYEWDDESVTKSEYIRQDDFAVAYRELCKRGLKLYPKTDKRKESFSIDDNSDAPKMCVFKKGKLVSIQAMPNGSSQSGIDAFAKIIVDNYKVVKDEKK